mgnify:CR=1 FL=1
MIHDSHKYGALTELRCAAELIKRDWYVAFPFIDSSAIDLIAFRESRFVTIQVKSGTMLKNGHARITKDFNKYKGVDFIVCYDVHNRRWFIFTFEDLRDKKSVTLKPSLYDRNCDNWSLIR